MKLKSILLSIVVGPVVGFVVSQILWILYPLLGSVVSVDNFNVLTSGVFALLWVGFAYVGLKKEGFKTKTKGKREKPIIKLDKDITLKDVTDTFRPSHKNPLLEFIIIGVGKNLHQVVSYKADAVYKLGDKELKIDNNNLLIQKPWGKRKTLTAIFTKDGEPITIKASDSKITAEILSLAERSTALGRTIKELFSTSLPLKKILFFVVIGIVAVVAFLLLTGGL